MHYILRTARCMHAWRSDTVAAVNARRAEAHTAELRAKNTSLKRLEEEIGELRSTTHAGDQDHVMKSVSTSDDLAARVVLLQELQRRTEDEHAHDLASLRLQLQQHNAAMNHMSNENYEATFQPDMQAMRISMAALQERCAMQEDDLRALRSGPPQDADLYAKLEMAQQKLSVAEVRTKPIPSQ